MARRAGEVVAERYRLEACLGEGGMGEVWAAEHSVTGKRVALKFLSPDRTQSEEARLRFLREARAASRVDHPSVVAVHDVVDLDDGSLAMVMDCLVGETLRQRLEDEGKLSASETATILLPVLSAVGTAHQAGVVHRDLKPENIFITERGESKVFDFGIAKLLEKEDVETGLTNTGALLGTPHYMSPEQVFGEKDVDARADVWSLGVILYECLCGERPFEGTNPGQVMKAVLIGDYEALGDRVEGVPEDLVDLTDRMLQLRRRDRMRDLVEAFEVLSQHTDVQASPFSAATELVASLPPPSDGSDPYAATKIDTGEAWDELRSFAKSHHEALVTGAPVSTVSDELPLRRTNPVLLVGAAGLAALVGAMVWLGASSEEDTDAATTSVAASSVAASPGASSVPPPRVDGTASATVTSEPTAGPEANKTPNEAASAERVASSVPVPQPPPPKPAAPKPALKPAATEPGPKSGDNPMGGVHPTIPF